MLDIALMGRPGADEIQLDLILDYRTNLERYPQLLEYFRGGSAAAPRGVGSS